MAGLLEALRTCANPEDNYRIGNILTAVGSRSLTNKTSYLETDNFQAEEEIAEILPTTASKDRDAEDSISPESRDCGSVTQGRKRSGEVMEVLEENLHGDQPRATGFVGKSSEMHWLRVALLQTEESEDGDPRTMSQRQGSYLSENNQVRTFSYWVDSEQPDFGFSDNVKDLPPPDVAERLLQCYIRNIQDSFPIFPRKTFEDRFLRHFRAVRLGTPSPLDPKWQAILNLVFAIAARYSHLTKADWRANDYDHLVYQARARRLGLSETIITNPADLQQVQGLGLLAFYWMSSGQVNRAWTVIGLAFRFAYALGLHVRNEDASATPANKETLVRTWWSLHWLESTLSTMTGRPSIIADSRCSVPLPMPIPEERISDGIDLSNWMNQRKDSLSTPARSSSSSSGMAHGSDRGVGLGRFEANSGSYFRATVQLSIITQTILSTLYAAGPVTQTPFDVHQDMSQIGRDLELWQNELPARFNLQQAPNAMSEPFIRERILLGFRFCSARILLTRPCLVGRKYSWNDSEEHNFATRSADSCVEAAKTMVGFLPDEPHSEMVGEQGPWFCITHHMMQALSVLLLALSCPASTSHDNHTSLQCTKKAIRWLQTIKDPVATDACRIALNVLEVIGSRYCFDCSDLWTLGNGDLTHASSHAQQPLPTFMASDLPHQMMSMPMSPIETVVASYASDAVMSGTAFSPFGSQQFHNPFYVADS